MELESNSDGIPGRIPGGTVQPWCGNARELVFINRNWPCTLTAGQKLTDKLTEEKSHSGAVAANEGLNHPLTVNTTSSSDKSRPEFHGTGIPGDALARNSMELEFREMPRRGIPWNWNPIPTEFRGEFRMGPGFRPALMCTTSRRVPW